MKTHISIQLRLITLAFFSIAFALLFACGGGGGGGVNTATTISGTALAPNGAVAQFKNQTFMYALNEILFPSAGAEITGLDPVPGALVELIEVDDAGNQVGPVLASSSTSITGHYDLNLPAGVSLAANLVVRITGTSVDLRAMVVQTAVDITPLSEYILRKFIDSTTPLSTLTVDDVVSISGHAAEFDLAATSDMSTMLAALEAELGPFIDDSIVAISGTPGSASAIAGGYHFNFLSMYLSYRNDPTYFNVGGKHESSAGGGLLTVTDDGGDSFGIIIGPDNDTIAQQFTSDNVNYHIGYYVDIGLGGETIPNLGTVNSNGDLNFTFPFSEDIWDDDLYGARTPPTSQNLYHSGVAGVRFSVFAGRAAIYHTLDTNSDGIKDAIDPDDLVGHEASFELGAVAPQGSGMTASGMAGEYGSVHLVNYFNSDGSSGVETGVSNSTIDASGNSTDTYQYSVGVERTPSGSPVGDVAFTERTETTPGLGGVVSLSPNGQLTYTGTGSTASFFGFVSSNGEFISLSLGDSEGAPVFTSAGAGQILSVRKPAGTPDLSGRTYRLLGIEKRMEDNGYIAIHRLRGDDDRLVFSSDGSQVTISYNGLDTASRPVDNADFTSMTQDVSGSLVHDVIISAGGAINFTETVAGIDGHTRNWTGYISASTNIIILNSYERANDGSQYSQGMFVAIPLL